MDRRFRFKKEARLKERERIRDVFKRGKMVTCSGAKLFLLKNDLSFNRVVFTFPRKYGNAVERNRARRVGREAYRHLCGDVKPGYDLALLVYPGRDFFAARMEQLRLLLVKAGLLCK